MPCPRILAEVLRHFCDVSGHEDDLGDVVLLRAATGVGHDHRHLVKVVIGG